MNYTIIAAVGKNKELGVDNHLIWNLPQDLKFFKEKTTGRTIIMGRKTFESLPRMLPKRHHIVLTRSSSLPEEVEVFDSVESLLEKYKDSSEEMFIIGGASLYNEFLNIANKMYLTEIEATYDKADTYFPNFNPLDWESEVIAENEDNGITYKHVLYKRK